MLLAVVISPSEKSVVQRRRNADDDVILTLFQQVGDINLGSRGVEPPRSAAIDAN
jgi:hypothetical protein